MCKEILARPFVFAFCKVRHEAQNQKLSKIDEDHPRREPMLFTLLQEDFQRENTVSGAAVGHATVLLLRLLSLRQSRKPACDDGAHDVGRNQAARFLASCAGLVSHPCS